MLINPCCTSLRETGSGWWAVFSLLLSWDLLIKRQERTQSQAADRPLGDRASAGGNMNHVMSKEEIRRTGGDTRQSSHDNWRGHTAICWQALAPFDGPSPWTAIPQSITSQLLTGVVKASRSLRVYCSVSTSETEAGLSNQVEYWEAANRPQALISFHWPWCYKVIQFPLAFSICNVTKLLSSHWPSVALMLQSYLKSIEDLYQSFYLLSSKSESIILFWYIKHRNQ